MSSGSKTKAKTVLETILLWSKDRPAWQRDALRRIINQGKIVEHDYVDLLNICKDSFSDNKSGVVPNPLDESHVPPNPDTLDGIILGSISDVKNANNLAANQNLSFEPDGITLIYGDNGAGKSGYFRILKKACYSRHSGEIHPNIYAEPAPATPASATIKFNVGSKEQPPHEWVDGAKRNSALSGVTVFDRDCAAIQLSAKNEVTFRPFGLDIPDALAAACQSLKERINTEIKHAQDSRSSNFLKPKWNASTAVGKLLSSLKYNADLSQIKTLATLESDELGRYERLKEDLAKNPARAAAEQKNRISNVNHLISYLQNIATETTDVQIKAVFDLAKEAIAKREAVKVAANEAFSGSLKGTGHDIWRLMWDAARRYSIQEAFLEKPFPPSTGSECLLCQQPLSVEAESRMKKFEDFIQSDLEKEAVKAKNAATPPYERIKSLVINLIAVKSGFEEVKLQNAQLADEIARYLASVRVRRYLLLKSLRLPVLQTFPLFEDPIGKLKKLSGDMQSYYQDLLRSTDDKERKKLENEYFELSDRILVKNIFQSVNEEIDRLKKIYILEKCLSETATHTITKLGNDIADAVITPKLRDRFQQEIVKLAGEKVRVEVIRSGGQYGSPHYQVKLFANPAVDIADILSEGEQTCVALASFLTELATAPHNSALVFDDPVSSLDHRWRQSVANRLVEESEKRQVVIFTHDIVFANNVIDLAVDNGRPVKSIYLGRGSLGAGMVADGMPWIGQRVEERIDTISKMLSKAKKLYEANQDEDYKHEVALIYNRLRATWERAIEDVAFFGVIQRHRDYINTKNLKKASVLTDKDCDGYQDGFKKCCDIVDAHDPSRARNATPPAPIEIAQDIECLLDWVKSLRQRQRAVSG